MYSLAKLAHSVEMLIVARAITGMGGNFYPSSQYLVENVGRKRRSAVLSNAMYMSRSIGLALGPAFAAGLSFIPPLKMGDLNIDKETNPGWAVAILAIGQTGLITWCFPRHGSRLLRRKAQGQLQEQRLPDTSLPQRTLKERVMHRTLISFVFLVYTITTMYPTSWEVSPHAHTHSSHPSSLTPSIL